MKTLLQPYVEYRRFFPAFPENESYCKQQFCIRTSVDAEDDASVLYNTLSGEVLVLSVEEDELWCSAPQIGIKAETPFWKKLAAHDFIVPQDTDMMDVLEKGRNQAKSISDRLDTFVSGTFSYVVLPTTDCNARCFYCYEKGRSRIKMDNEVALKTAKFIEANFRKNGREVQFEWFGGEPLYNIEAIRVICGYLDSHSVPFSSTMISNGYLLNGELQEEAQKDWHLTFVQITLDGTEETYNRCKAFIYPKSEGSPFLRVMDNIISTARRGISVSIRLNVDSHNFENLMDLTGILAQKISSDEALQKKISVYCHPLFEGNTHPQSVNRPETVAGYEIALTRKIMAHNAETTESKSKLEVKRGPKLHYCMVDSPFSLVITPDGHFGKCEHFTEDHFVGSLDGEVDTDRIRDMAQFEKPHDDCYRCPFPPRCYHVSICPDIERDACITKPIIEKAKTDLVLEKLYKKCHNDAKDTPDSISYNPKVDDNNLSASPLEVIAGSHNSYSVLGKNGNALCISFVSMLEMGSHNIQAMQFDQVGDKRKFPKSDDELLKSIAYVAEAYLHEHPADLLMMCDPADSRSGAIHRFIGSCFDRFGYGEDFRKLQMDGKGSDGQDQHLSIFLSRHCPSFDDVVEAISQQSSTMIDYYREITENGKREGFQNYGQRR